MAAHTRARVGKEERQTRSRRGSWGNSKHSKLYVLPILSLGLSCARSDTMRLQASIHAIMESDDRVTFVIKHLDDALAELDKMDLMMGLYKTQLSVSFSCFDRSDSPCLLR